jgi:hypothetical protein
LFYACKLFDTFLERIYCTEYPYQPEGWKEKERTLAPVSPISQLRSPLTY